MNENASHGQDSIGSRRKDGHKPKIAIIGSGVVGQATGMALLNRGFDITFVDNNIDVVKELDAKGHKATLTEGLDPRVDPHWLKVASKFRYKAILTEVLDPQQISIFFVSVPTYVSADDGGISYMRTAAENLGVWLSLKSDYSLVVIRSTILPGTTEKVIIPTMEKYSGKKAGQDFGVCVNPEYLRQKSAVSDFDKPWVVTIGEMDKRDGDILQDIYYWVDCPVHRVSIREAEMQKFVHNLFNANKIAFFNEMRQVCRELDISSDKMFQIVTQSAEGMWNPAYGTKDMGPFAGACLPKDSKAFRRYAEENLKMPMRVLQAMLDSNEDLIKNYTESLVK
jgi:nucleotide sugar dehydrogenase